MHKQHFAVKINSIFTNNEKSKCIKKNIHNNYFQRSPRGGGKKTIFFSASQDNNQKLLGKKNRIKNYFCDYFPYCYLFIIYTLCTLYNNNQTMWYEKCIVLLLVGMIFILGTKKKKLRCITEFLRGFMQSKWFPVSYQHQFLSPTCFRTVTKYNHCTNCQQKPKRVICNVYTSLLTKGLFFEHKHTSGLLTSQKASWYIYGAHAWKITTVNLVLSVH